MSLLHQPDVSLLITIIVLCLLALVAQVVIRYQQKSFRRRDEAFSKTPPKWKD